MQVKKNKSLIKRIYFVFANPQVYINLLKYKYTIFLEKQKGLDFTAIEQAPQLEFTNQELNGYWSSDNHFLIDVLDTLHITQDDAMLDIGCGKGAALVRFSKYSFKKIAGIEYTKKLSEVAHNNLKILGVDIPIFNTDAQTFDDYKSYNYFYLYNPFSGEIMKNVIQKIEDSVKENPRKITIIYKNAVCDEMITQSGLLKKTKTCKNQDNELPFYIYTNDR